MSALPHPGPPTGAGFRPGPTTETRVTRYLKVQPPLLWRGFTDGATLVHWFRPGGIELASALVDPRRGGRFDLTQTRAGARLETINCCVLDLDENRLFAVTTALGAEYRPTGTKSPATLIVEFHEIASGTRLEARLMHAENAEASPLIGWEEGLAHLEQLSTR
ncbi:SRPBCC domain-containing protein [Maritimibacter sp. DP1N21-5]|uniref:SRPBCC domain-containing protein n=1 Tax=Maritimibacter sp. DP1N21-5 TaxID=2836867 RepID=UPI001C462081|nr:SRPBCC domain-containing protein [Maritimibacter sp. DP1N21-5]MBV7407534.1 SRPBCC domain-containing protein [Maritimibacter sp. DP1N21-5]